MPCCHVGPCGIGCEGYIGPTTLPAPVLIPSPHTVCAKHGVADFVCSECWADDRREIGRLRAEVEGKARELEKALGDVAGAQEFSEYQGHKITKLEAEIERLKAENILRVARTQIAGEMATMLKTAFEQAIHSAVWETMRSDDVKLALAKRVKEAFLRGLTD